MLRAPGRNADGVAELAVALLLAVHPRHRRRRSRRARRARCSATARSPTSASGRGRSRAGPSGSSGSAPSGARPGGASRASACGSARYDPFAADATDPDLDEMLARGRRRVDARRRDARDPRPHRRRPVRAHARRRRLRQHRPGRAPRPRRPHRGPRRPATSRPPALDHFEGEALAADHPLAAMPNVVLTPHIGGATYDTEANHTRSIADGLAALVGRRARRRTASTRRCSSVGDSSPTTTKEEVLATAKQMLADGLVEGTAGNISGRLDDDRVCLTPSSVAYETMTLDDLVVVDLDGNVVEGHRVPDHREGPPPLGAARLSGARRRHPHPRRLRHDVRPRPRADPRRDRGGRRVPRRRRPVLRLQGHRDAGARRRGRRRSSPTAARRCSPTTASSRAARTRPRPCTTPPSPSARPRSCGAPGRRGWRSCPLPEKVNADMAGVYRFMRENPGR